MSIAREVLRRRFLIGELAVINIALLSFAFLHRSIWFLLFAAAFVILLCTLIWIEKLYRHDVSNFDVCMSLGAFSIVGSLWLSGYRIAAALVGSAAVLGAIWLIAKLLRPVDADDQLTNLEKYRAQWRADKFSRSLVSELSGLIAPLIAWSLIWRGSGFSKTVLWTIVAITAYFLARILFLRRLSSEDDKLGPLSVGNNQ